MGRAEFVLHTELPVTVLCAKEGFEAHVTRDYLLRGPMATHMRHAPGGGSGIIANRAGEMSRIRGRLNPILDDDDRAYLYADNIAINDGQNQPARFVLTVIAPAGSEADRVLIDPPKPTPLLQRRSTAAKSSAHSAASRLSMAWILLFVLRLFEINCNLIIFMTMIYLYTDLIQPSKSNATALS